MSIRNDMFALIGFTSKLWVLHKEYVHVIKNRHIYNIAFCLAVPNFTSAGIRILKKLSLLPPWADLAKKSDSHYFQRKMAIGLPGRWAEAPPNLSISIGFHHYFWKACHYYIRITIKIVNAPTFLINFHWVSPLLLKSVSLLHKDYH